MFSFPCASGRVQLQETRAHREIDRCGGPPVQGVGSRAHVPVPGVHAQASWGCKIIDGCCWISYCHQQPSIEATIIRKPLQAAPPGRGRRLSLPGHGAHQPLGKLPHGMALYGNFH